MAVNAQQQPPPIVVPADPTSGAIADLLALLLGNNGPTNKQKLQDHLFDLARQGVITPEELPLLQDYYRNLGTDERAAAELDALGAQGPTPAGRGPGIEAALAEARRLNPPKVKQQTPDQQAAAAVRQFAERFLLSNAEAGKLKQAVLAQAAGLDEAGKRAVYAELLAPEGNPDFDALLEETLTKSAQEQFDAAWGGQYDIFKAYGKDENKGALGLTTREQQMYKLLALEFDAEKVSQRETFTQAYFSRLGQLSRAAGDQASQEYSGLDPSAWRQTVLDAKEGYATDVVEAGRARLLQQYAPEAIRPQAGAAAANAGRTWRQAVQQTIRLKAGFYDAFDAALKRLAGAAENLSYTTAKQTALNAAYNAAYGQQDTLLRQYLLTGGQVPVSAFLDQLLTPTVTSAAGEYGAGLPVNNLTQAVNGLLTATSTADQTAAFLKAQGAYDAAQGEQRLKDYKAIGSGTATDRRGRPYHPIQAAYARGEAGMPQALSDTGNILTDTPFGGVSQGVIDDYLDLISNLSAGFDNAEQLIVPGQHGIPTLEQYAQAVAAGDLAGGGGTSDRAAELQSQLPEDVRRETVRSQYAGKYALADRASETEIQRQKRLKGGRLGRAAQPTVTTQLNRDLPRQNTNPYQNVSSPNLLPLPGSPSGGNPPAQTNPYAAVTSPSFLPTGRGQSSGA